MNVTLLRHTPDPETAVAMASRLCYSPVGIAGIERRWSRRSALALVKKILSLGHHSVLEHVSFTFGIEGISRATSHQLVRHRIASYSQQSQRYVRADECFEHVVPPSIRADRDLRRDYARAMREAGRLYRRLLDAGVPPEDCRFVLPNAAATRIIVTMNARELRHFFHLRCCRRAQWEIREMAERMCGLARRRAPVLFEGAGPGCVTGPCPEGKLTCGRTKEVRAAYRSWSRRAARPQLPRSPTAKG